MISRFDPRVLVFTKKYLLKEINPLNKSQYLSSVVHGINTQIHPKILILSFTKISSKISAQKLLCFSFILYRVHSRYIILYLQGGGYHLPMSRPNLPQTLSFNSSFSYLFIDPMNKPNKKTLKVPPKSQIMLCFYSMCE